ncbi:MAG: ACT domain-containing protein [Actinomycetota bacterium]|nr:ACT domain-containing protein [Actinomycetota bacterium]
MSSAIVLTLTGPDRTGIVEEITRITLGLNGNVDTSRMVRLGGEFAVLMLASMPASRVEVEAAFAPLVSQGYRLTVSATVQSPQSAAPLYSVEVSGADHEGIVHEIATKLAVRGINIESMETGTVASPITGTPLFMMKAVVAVPYRMPDDEWVEALQEAGHQANVDVTITRL